MTILSTITKQSFECNGSLREFDFTFTAVSVDDIKALIRDSDGVDTELTALSQYSVTLNPDGSGGTLTTVSAWALGNTLIVYRETSRTQETEYKNNQFFDQEILEKDLDKIVMVLQEDDKGISIRDIDAAIIACDTAVTARDAAVTARDAAIIASNAAEDFKNSASGSASSASSSAEDAANAAAAAEETAGAEKWVAGMTYAIGDVVWSPINYRAYRRKTDGAGTIDPSSDAINWTALLPFATAAEITTGTEVAKAIAPDQLRDSEATAAEIVTGTEKKLITADQAHTSLMKVSGSNLAIGSDADGDMYYRAASILARLAKGTAYQQLNMNSGATAPEWKASLQSLLTAAGDTIYASAANTPARLAKGTDGQVLTLSAGVPSWASGGLADASVTQAKLKTSTGSVSTTSTIAVNLTLPGGEYGFYPQVYGSVTAHIAAFPANDAYTTNIALNVSAAGWTAYARQRYVTSSGEVHWVFILRDKATKQIISMYQAPDHPCFGNGGKPLLVPHPFGDYDPEKHEIIVINPSDEDIFNMQDACIMPEDKPDRDILEVIMEDYEIDEDLQTEWPKKEITVGLPKNVDWKRMPEGSKIVPVKKYILQPEYITTRKLWKRK